MYNDKPKFTRLTLEQSDLKLIYEVPFEDVDGNDLIHAMATIMKGMTFHDKGIYVSLAEYLKENADDMYDVIKKEE